MHDLVDATDEDRIWNPNRQRSMHRRWNANTNVFVNIWVFIGLYIQLNMSFGEAESVDVRENVKRTRSFQLSYWESLGYRVIFCSNPQFLFKNTFWRLIELSSRVNCPSSDIHCSAIQPVLLPRLTGTPFPLQTTDVAELRSADASNSNQYVLIQFEAHYTHVMWLQPISNSTILLQE